MMRLARKLDESPEVIGNDGERLADSDSRIDIQEYLRILWRRKGIILATTAAIMTLAILIISFLTPRYTATSVIQINPRKTQVVDFEAVLSGLPADTETIQTEIAVIRSRKIALRAIERLELSRDPEFNPALRARPWNSSWRHTAAAWVASLAVETESLESAGEANPDDEQRGTFNKLIMQISSLLDPSGMGALSEEEQVKREKDRVIDNYLYNLTVEPIGRSRIIHIAFQSEKPKTAAAAANAVADFYIVAQLESKFEATRRATTWLNERVEQLRKEVQAKEQAVEEYRAKSGLLQGEGEMTLTSEEVSSLNAQHVLELARLAEAEARLRQVNELLRTSGGIESSSEVLDSPLIQDFRREESRLERDVAELSEEYGELHSKMINARAELRDLRSKIKIEVDRAVQGLRNEVAVARARVSSISRSLGRVKKQVAALNASEVGLRALEREATASRILLETLLQRAKQTVSQESFQEADADIVSMASMPEDPSFPRKGILFPMFFFGAFVQGIVLAFVAEKLDSGFRSADQIKHILGIKPLGLIPKLTTLTTVGKAPHEYVLQNPESAFGQAIRSLYTNVLLTDLVQRPNVILVTSALPREGKTVVTLSMARVLAAAGQKVIVVDCDLLRPTVHEELGIQPGPGLTDCLIEGALVDEVVQVDPKSGAHVLRAGMPVQNSPDLLDSWPMQKLLKGLRRKYDLVLLDSAPILASSETLFVARLADKTIFLTRWAKTRRASASLALTQILAAQADVAGGLLTMVNPKSHAQYGFGDSGSYYGTLQKYYTKR